MSFWSSTTAAPSLLHILSTAHPRYLRTTPAPPPYKHGFVAPRIACREDASSLAEFWKTYYGGLDWMLEIQVRRVIHIIETSLVLLLFHSGKMVASIVSSPAGSTAYFSHGAVLDSLRIIEGLCVHPDWRGKSVAGYMIGWMDHLTSQRGPVAHLWSREMRWGGLFSTAVAIQTYAYLHSQYAIEKIRCYPMTWADFCNLQKKHHSRKSVRLAAGHGSILFADLKNLFGLLSAWRSLDGLHYAVTYNTERWSLPEHLPIHEVIWHNGPPQTAADFLESVASHMRCMLFASSGEMQGGATAAWKFPWTYGTSGVHAWYIYNYIPPAFGDCELDIIREDI